jgi:uncharacterized protein YyaL (SSP411 family)
LTGDSAYSDRASRMMKAFSEDVRRAPSAHAFMLVGVGFAVGPAYSVILVGDREEEGMRRLLDALKAVYVPNMVVSLRQAGKAGLGYEKIGDRATAYVCRGQTCMPPTADLEKMLALLGLS